MGLKITSFESGGILNIAKYFLSNSSRHAEPDNCEVTTSSPLRSWSFLLLNTLMTMKPSLKEISLLILEISSNLKKPNKDKTYMETSRNSTSQRAIISKFRDLEAKSEFHAFPLIKRPDNLGKNTQSITKLF